MASLCHPWFTTTNLSYRFPIFETSATALCGTTGILCIIYYTYIYIYVLYAIYILYILYAMFLCYNSILHLIADVLGFEIHFVTWFCGCLGHQRLSEAKFCAQRTWTHQIEFWLVDKIRSQMEPVALLTRQICPSVVELGSSHVSEVASSPNTKDL